jgi:hypothetical protein
VPPAVTTAAATTPANPHLATRRLSMPLARCARRPLSLEAGEAGADGLSASVESADEERGPSGAATRADLAEANSGSVDIAGRTDCVRRLIARRAERYESASNLAACVADLVSLTELAHKEQVLLYVSQEHEQLA